MTHMDVGNAASSKERLPPRESPSSIADLPRSNQNPLGGRGNCIPANPLWSMRVNMGVRTTL